MQQLLYRDARNYAPVDVTKGVDLLTKEVVLGDDPAPKGYEPTPKCKLCKHYKATEELLGTCEASPHEPKFVAYGDMISVTCAGFEKK